jgi:hypothetical protein
MARPDTATISYETFIEMWERLVSKRKARKHDIDLEDLWAQLAAGRRVELRSGDDDDLDGPRNAKGKRGKKGTERKGEAAHKPAARQASEHAVAASGSEPQSAATKTVRPAPTPPRRKPARKSRRKPQGSQAGKSTRRPTAARKRGAARKSAKAPRGG